MRGAGTRLPPCPTYPPIRTSRTSMRSGCRGPDWLAYDQETQPSALALAAALFVAYAGVPFGHAGVAAGTIVSTIAVGLGLLRIFM